MSSKRYRATHLADVLREQERTIAWLSRKTGVSYALMNYIVHNQRTASAEVAKRVAEVLRTPLFLLFVTTDVVSVASSEESIEVSA